VNRSGTHHELDSRDGFHALERGGPDSRGHGFVRDARGFAKINVAGASVTAAFGSNSGGQIVGAYLDARKRVHGFRREGRRLRTIDFPGAKGTFASGINDRGRVVGSYTEDGAPGASMVVTEPSRS